MKVHTGQGHLRKVNSHGWPNPRGLRVLQLHQIHHRHMIAWEVPSQKRNNRTEKRTILDIYHVPTSQATLSSTYYNTACLVSQLVHICSSSLRSCHEASYRHCIHVYPIIRWRHMVSGCLHFSQIVIEPIM